MKRSLLVVLLAAALMKPAQAAEAFNPLHKDKILHMTVSLGITYASARAFQHLDLPLWQSVLFASLVTMGAGLAKEAIDPIFDGQDLIADGIGTAAGASLILIFPYGWGAPKKSSRTQLIRQPVSR